jgi:hypothetical protein
MTNFHSSGHENFTEAKLPRRDWILLPLISLLTVSLMVVSMESLSRRIFSASKTTVATGCMILNDAVTGPRAVPNTVCWEKTPEGPLAEYRFNSCGHRAGVECGPKRPGTYRIVMSGSSFAFGLSTPREETFAALLPAELSGLTGRPVELYNESMVWQAPGGVDKRFDKILAAKPDLVLWVVTSWDIAHTAPDPGLPAEPGFLGRTRYRVKAALATHSIANAIPNIVDAMHDLLDVTSSGLLLEHFLYESQTQYLKSYLRNDDAEAGFLRAEPSKDWQNFLWYFEKDVADIADQAKAAGVPLVVVLLPNRAQAAMISMGEWPPGNDPYKLGDEIRSIVVSHGGTYVDILPGYRTVPNAEQGYFPKDGHPNAEGHATISRLIARELSGGAVPALRVVPGPQAIVKKGD